MSWNATSRGEIFVIDDDAATRETLTESFQEKGYEVISFADGAALLSYARTRTPVCVFVEVGASDRSGFELLKKLRSESCPAPIFVTSAEGCVPMAVDAIRNGAFDFIAKPFLGEDIVVRLDAALGKMSRAAVEGIPNVPLYVPGSEPLTNREREVLGRLVHGETNKEIARQLGLSARTVEGYRASIIRKAGVRNSSELLRRVFSQPRHA
ncbi:MAG: response regulator [bacterium]|nr:response regulator [bacterium]